MDPHAAHQCQEAYAAVMRCLVAGGLDFSKEALISLLRAELHITNAQHQEIRAKAVADPELAALAAGRVPPRSSALPSADGSFMQNARAMGITDDSAGGAARRGPGRPRTKPPVGTPDPDFDVGAGPAALPQHLPKATGGIKKAGAAASKKKGPVTAAKAVGSKLIGRKVLRKRPGGRPMEGVILQYSTVSEEHFVVFGSGVTATEEWLHLKSVRKELTVSNDSMPAPALEALLAASAQRQHQRAHAGKGKSRAAGATKRQEGIDPRGLIAPAALERALQTGTTEELATMLAQLAQSEIALTQEIAEMGDLAMKDSEINAASMNVLQTELSALQRREAELVGDIAQLDQDLAGLEGFGSSG